MVVLESEEVVIRAVREFSWRPTSFGWWVVVLTDLSGGTRGLAAWRNWLVPLSAGATLRECVRTMRVDWDERAVGRDFSDDASSSSREREAWARDGLVESSRRGWRCVSGLVDAGSWHEYSPQAEKTGNFSQASSAIRSIQLIQRDGSAGSWQHHRVSLVPVDIGDQSAGRSVGPTARNEREWPRRTPS